MNWSALATLLRQNPVAALASAGLCADLEKEAQGAARYVAQHLGERDDIAAELSAQCGEVWWLLEGWWIAIALDLDPVGSDPSSDDAPLIAAVVALAKLERNLIAGHEAHQTQALIHEPFIRRSIFNLTIFARIEDSRYSTAQAILTQLLANLVSPISGEPAAQRTADGHLHLYLSGKREDDVVIRLLDSADLQVNTATLHLIANLTRNSLTRLRLLLEPAGLQWCTRILVRMEEWHKSADDGRFELACGIFIPFITAGLQGEVFGKLAAHGEPITPSQMTVLKLLDSRLSSTSTSSDLQHPVSAQTPVNGSPSNAFLVPLFHLFSAYALTSIRSKADDVRLPLVFEALVLVSQCLSSIGLRLQARLDSNKHEVASTGSSNTGLSTSSSDPEDEEIIAECRSPDDDRGIVQSLIELLSGLNDLLPRVKPGTSPPSAPGGATNPLAPLAGLKRDLVQLLGILSFGDRQVGDLVRQHGGVHLVLGMTEVDESNPFLREHALFCVRNLLLNNAANQAVIAEMDPAGVVSETGELLPLPERMRRQR